MRHYSSESSSSINISKECRIKMEKDSKFSIGITSIINKLKVKFTKRLLKIPCLRYPTFNDARHFLSMHSNGKRVKQQLKLSYATKRWN